MKILVTGGAGFIGSNFINYWLNKYQTDSIINLNLMTYAANELTVEHHKNQFKERYEFVKGDICDEKLVNELVSQCYMVVHFAAESHVDKSVEDSSAFVRTNVLGTHTLLESSRKNSNKRFHHVSTDEVFGTLELGSNERFSEQTPYNPRSPYSASKAGSDHLVKAYYETYQLPVTITNCSNNYGPFQFPEKVIPLYITRLLKQKEIPVYGKGLAVRDYLYVEDHCSAIDAVIKNGRLGETYCVGGDSEKNTNQIAKLLAEKLNQPDSLIVYTKDRPDHDPRYVIDHSKITKELGWMPSVNFEEGIDKIISWYKENTDWWQPISAKAEEIAEKYLQNRN